MLSGRCCARAVPNAARAIPSTRGIAACQTAAKRSPALPGALVLAALLAPLSLPSPAALELVEVPVDASLGVGIADDEVMQLQLEVEPRWESKRDDGNAFVASLRLRLDGRDELEPGTPAFDNYATLSAPITLGDTGTIELRDVYWQRRSDRGLLRLGKQQIVWGRLDGIKILDVVNPQTFREFILDDLGNSRISQWSAYLDMTLGSWRAELTWVPDITSHDIPEAGAWFELAAPRFRFGAPAGSAGLPTVTDRDASVLDDGAYGARLSRLIGGVDVAAVLYSGRDHEPLGRVVARDGGPVLEQFYRRREVLGLSAESSLGPVAWRAELSHQPGRVFNVRDAAGLATRSLDQTTLGVGADIDLPLNLLANLQFVVDRVDGAPTELVRPDEDRLVTLFLRRGFAYDTVRTELRWYHSLTDHDDTIMATARYELNDDTSVYVSGEWFTGTPEGLFGQFARQDRVYFGIRRFF